MSGRRIIIKAFRAPPTYATTGTDPGFTPTTGKGRYYLEAENLKQIQTSVVSAEEHRQGHFVLYREVIVDMHTSRLNLTRDQFSMRLLNHVPDRASRNLGIENFTEVAGSGYEPGGIKIRLREEHSTIHGGFSVYLIEPHVDIQWLRNPNGPTDIHTVLLFDDTINTALGHTYISTDIHNPVSLRHGDLTINHDAGLLFSLI